MNFEEFLKPEATSDVSEGSVPTESAGSVPTESGSVPTEEAVIEDEMTTEEDLSVQKEVVQSLAADKVEQEETISKLRKDNYALQTEIAALKEKLSERDAELAKVGDILAQNSESALSNKIALLDRDINVPDRFEGETREHVLEAVREARNKAEADGRCRCAQVLEGVLAANESTGILAEKRSALEKLFNTNANIVSGPVIEELKKLGISHKNGEDYLLPSEIIKRTY